MLQKCFTHFLQFSGVHGHTLPILCCITVAVNNFRLPLCLDNLSHVQTKNATWLILGTNNNQISPVLGPNTVPCRI